MQQYDFLKTRLARMPFQAVYSACLQLPPGIWRKLISLILLVYLLFLAAQSTWLLLPGSTSSLEAATPQSTKVPAKAKELGVDVAGLLSVELFGAVTADAELETQAVVKKPEQLQLVDVKPTKLNLRLEGIISASDPKQSMAIILSEGLIKLYGIGDRLSGVGLHQIYPDHVILDNGGKHESLWLFGEDNEEDGRALVSILDTPQVAVTQLDMRADAKVTSLAKSYYQRLYNNPASMADVIRFAPTPQDSVIKGYRINPGKDKAQFAALGLKPNDVITRINGLSVNDPASVLDVYKAMRTAREAEITIDRNDEEVVLRVTLGE